MHGSLDTVNNIPTFILKLWKLVGDENTNPLICWNRNGRSFIIKDQARFAKEVLPLYFKHNNMASFIRQLNMYGFRKVSNIEQGGLKSDADEVEFFHNFFVKAHEEQLQFIKRKMSNNKAVTSIVKVDEVHEILSDVELMKGRQDSVDSMLNNLKRENEALWREVAILRQKHMKQQQIVEKLLHFLVSIVRNQVVTGMKRKAPLMIDASSGNNRKIIKSTKDGVCMAASPGPSGPIISDITDLEENDDLTPLMNEPPPNQLISTLPINLETSNSNTLKQLEGTSILASNDDQVCKFTDGQNALNILPNNLLDFDLNDVPSSSNTIPECELIDEEQINSQLNTPQISLLGSPMPNTPQQQVATSSPMQSNQANETMAISTPGPSNVPSTDLVVTKQAPSSPSGSPLPRLTTDAFNDHIDVIDEELKWLQDQLYGNGLNIDPSAIYGIFSTDDQFANIMGQEGTSSLTGPKAIMSGSTDNNEGNIIKTEDNTGNETNLFEELDLNSINQEDKDLLSNFPTDLDPTTFT